LVEHDLFRKPAPTFRDHALADESCDFRVVRALRAAGHDVTTVVEVAPGAEDATIIEMAVRERRVFVTEDRDFGQLVYASATPTSGVIPLRFQSTARANLPAMVVDVVARHGERLGQRFVVLQPGRVRFGGIPNT
jgi:predicted nuclease of predicted toxin-antitoxin system